MKTAIYGLINGLTSIILFEIINSIGYLNGKLSTTVYFTIAIVAVILCLINYKLTKEMPLSGSIRFSMFAILAFLISILPSIIIVGVFLNKVLNLVIPVKVIEDDMGAGILLMVVIISYGIGMITSHLLSCGIKVFKTYFGASRDGS